MQEEVENRTVNLAISTTKLTGRTSNIEPPIFAFIQRFSDRSCVPDLTRLAFDFWQRCVIEGVLCDDVPAHSLFESASKQFVDALNIGRRHILRFAVSVLKNRAFRPL